MKHLKDALTFLQNGHSTEAMDVIDDLLAFSPRNPEALRLKAYILDRWGYFAEAFSIVAQLDDLFAPPEKPPFDDVLSIVREEKKVKKSRMTTALGCHYRASEFFTKVFAFLGILGCFLFFCFFPGLLGEIPLAEEILFPFFLLVVLPLCLLLFFWAKGVKRIFVSPAGLTVFYAFTKKILRWDDLRLVTVEFDPNLDAHHLRLIFYSRFSENPEFSLNISSKNSEIPARRHFALSVFCYAKLVCYVKKNKN